MNIYLLQRGPGDYREVTREEANQKIEAGEAHWIGSDADPETGDIVHYADLGGPE